MQVHNRRDLIAGLGVVIIGVAYFAETFRIQVTNDPVGPESLPRLVGVALIVLGLFIGGSAFRAKPPEDVEATMLAAAGKPDAGAARSAGSPSAASSSAVDDDDGGLPDEPEEPPVQMPKLLLYLGLFAAYAVLFIPLGFLLATSVFLFTLTTIYSRDRWLRNLLFSVIFTVVVYFAFKEGLGVFLPAGLIG